MTDHQTIFSPPRRQVEADASADVAALDLMHALTGPPFVLARPPEGAADAAPAGIVVAEFAGISPDGTPLLRLPGQPHVVRARSVVALSARLVGRQVLVVHETGRPAPPIVTGVLREAEAAAAFPALPTGAPFALEVDGERVDLVAQHQLVLRCGEASITLTREGKILLRGTYVSSSSSGVHRIHGAAVEIN
jgi:hypothetical protein